MRNNTLLLGTIYWGSPYGLEILTKILTKIRKSARCASLFFHFSLFHYFSFFIISFFHYFIVKAPALIINYQFSILNCLQFFQRVQRLRHLEFHLQAVLHQHVEVLAGRDAHRAPVVDGAGDEVSLEDVRVVAVRSRHGHRLGERQLLPAQGEDARQGRVHTLVVLFLKAHLYGSVLHSVVLHSVGVFEGLMDGLC